MDSDLKHTHHGGEKGAVPPFEGRTSNVGGENLLVATVSGEQVNASGHPDQLQRQYSIWSICGLALTIDNAWVALGGSIVVAVANGGPPGILYEYLAACAYYGIIAACIAELASAVPSAGGVYHWASLTPGKKWGRVIGFFAGWISFFGWIFDFAAILQITANVAVALYSVYHPDLIIQPWHVYIAYLLILWLCVAVVIFGNRIIPYLQDLGLFLVLAGGFVTIVVVAAMPSQHATNSFVWTDWENLTGWSDGVAFLAGVLNGAFAIGTPDAITHMAEELPNPKRDLPRAVAAQIILGTLTGFVYAIAILYGINDLNAVINSNGSFPLAEVYAQATNNNGATFGLLFIIFSSLMICVIGTILTISRIWWTLARDNATPFAGFFARVNERLSCPVPATLFCALFGTGLGAIPLGSKTAFQDLIGSFIILSTMSFVLAIAPNILTLRRNIPPGPFTLGRFGLPLNIAAVTLIIFFNVFYCFPYFLPADATLMNYNSVILVGCFTVTGIWWFAHGIRHYPGPKLVGLYLEGIDVRPDGRAELSTDGSNRIEEKE